MKRLLLLLLICISLVIAAGCAKQEQAPPEATTVMIYMVGSDLESRSGSGTEDLQEMAASGVDLSNVNVLVYAGGTPKWHNDLASPEQHTLLRLTEQGFEPVTTTESYSMGDGQCLSSFLSYGYTYFPADHYGLILWDHGNGPVIGYGKDMLFDNDCLTLKEMEQALADSPFSSENKLDWVGFDACLMASAELAWVWAPYADYLIASQEVEPAFGWNYSFLSQVSACSTEALTQAIAQSYLDQCQAYFEERGFRDRDATLSCLKLSALEGVEQAMQQLFDKAATDVPSQYNQLTARRANTRALGRASTGSEYDLVDLKDMAMWLGELYPQEASALIEAIDAMVFVNATNTQSLCGLSLYYPFHNKPYYEKDWAAAYEELGAFPAYLQYLAGYEQIWLQNDKLDTATSASPVSDDGVYTLQLTKEQTENLASAKYYILVRDGEEYFTRIFSSSDVDNQNGHLTAGFDGNVLYVTDDFGNYHIPVSTETDRVGQTGRYLVPVALTNCSLDVATPEGFELKSQAHRYSINIHKDTDQVTVSALTPYDNQTDGDLVNGKKSDSDLSQWTNAYFFHDSHRYLSRYENGAVMPVEQWPEDTVISGRSYAIENGLHFEYAPLVSGEYYLLFEMEDTQGNRYCSELLPIHTDGALPAPEASTEPTALSWQKDSLLLSESQGVQVWLEKVESFGSEGYALKASNSNSYPVIVTGSDLYGDDLLCRDNFGYLEVEPGQTAQSDYGMDLGPLSKMGLPAPGKLRFDLSVYHGITYAAKLHRQPFEITLSESTQLKSDDTSTSFNSFSQPAFGCKADEQLLFESQQLRIRLVGIGSNGMDQDIRGAVLVENLTDQPVVLELEGMRIDALYVPIYMTRLTVPAGQRTYALLTVEDYDLRYTALESGASMELLLRQYEYNPLYSGNSKSQTTWCAVTLAQAGQAGTPPQGKLLYEKDGIRISLVHTQREFDYRNVWYLAVTNTTQQDIGLDLVDCLADGEAADRFTSISGGSIPAGTTAICQISHSNYESKQPCAKLQFTLRIMDFKKEAILYTIREALTLKAE